ncbi:hypothetical protein RQP46_010579 [Phenoliferia psychrophenolica]
MGLVDAFLLPLQLLVLLLLHVAFALYRLGRVVSHLVASPAPDSSSSSAASGPLLDSARWDKTPQHLAVIFVPSKLSWSFSRRRSERAELAKLVEDLQLLLRWAEQLNCVSLSVYDEHGILDRNAEAVTTTLAASFPLLSPPKPSSTTHDLSGSTTFRVALPRLARLKGGGGDDLDSIAGREVDSGCGSSDVASAPVSELGGTFSASASTLVATPSPSSSSTTASFLTVSLLSRLSGRPHLAHLAQQLSQRLQSSNLKKLPEGAVEEVVEASNLAEPDLLIVLGGPYLRLHGFPPWQVRLTEFYHHPSPSWLPPPPLTYTVFRRALDLYGHAEKRLGR